MEKLSQNESAAETSYDREAVHEQAAEQLKQMLAEVKLSEEVCRIVPEKFHELAALELLRSQIVIPEPDNGLRHVAEALGEEMYKVEAQMAPGDFTLYQIAYRAHVLMEDTASEAA